MKSLIDNQQYEVDQFDISKCRTIKQKLRALEYLEPLLPDHLRSLENFYHFISRLQIPERIVFVIAKEICNDHTVYEKLLEKQLYVLNTLKIRKNKNEEEENQKEKKNTPKNNIRNGSYPQAIKALVDRGIVKKNTECPHCKHKYTVMENGKKIERKLPEFCVECGLSIFKQRVKFEKKSNHPYHTLSLTPKGKEYLKEIIDSYFKAFYFSIECLKYFKAKLVF